LIQHDISPQLASEPAAPSDEQARFPATASQSRHWRIQARSPRSSALNVAFRLDLSGPVEAVAIERALNRLISRHEILRTSFAVEADQLQQVVRRNARLRLMVHDLSSLDAEARAAEGERIGRDEARRPFDLSSTQFIRARWLRLTDRTGELLLTFHAMVMDGWSFAIVVRELVDALEAEVGGIPVDFEPVELHHGDYSLWKDALLASDAVSPSRAFWRRELAEYRRFEVKTDHQRQPSDARESLIASQLLPEDLTHRLLERGRADGVTLFNLACAALVMALAAREAAAEVVLGTQVSTRDQQELESIVGPLLNSVVLRVPVQDGQSRQSLVALCADKTNAAITHGQIPFEELMNFAGIGEDPVSPPLYSVNLTLQQSFVGMGDVVSRRHVSARLLRSYDVGAQYDLGFFMVARPEGWRISCDGDIGLYTAATLDRLLADWCIALEQIAVDVGAQPSRVPVPVPTRSSEMAAIIDNVITYHPEGPGTPVIFLNNTAVLYDLAERLSPDRPLIDVPMTPPGGPQLLPDRPFPEIAADTLRLIRAVRPAGPYILMGHCVLGSLGLEVARQLRDEGEVVELVVLNDSWLPGIRETMPWWDRFLRRLQLHAYYVPKDFARWRRRERSLLEYVGQYGTLRRLGIIALMEWTGWFKGGRSDYAVLENRWYTDYLLRQQKIFRPPPYAGDVQIFRSQEPRRGRLFPYDFGWGTTVAGRLEISEVPTLHDTMFRSNGADVIGAVLNRQLGQNRARATD
jgi:thioesterase domain-containing protein